MLLLTRHIEESVRIGNDIEVKILAVERGQVTLGITAPARIPVHRREIYDAIRLRNLDSSGTAPADLDRVLGIRQKPGPSQSS